MLKHFCGLHVKSLIDLKIFGATFGIGGEIAPIAPPLATRLLRTNLLELEHHAGFEKLTR